MVSIKIYVYIKQMESHIAKNFHFFKKHDECLYNVSHYIFAQKKCAVDLKQQEIKKDL